MRTLWALALSFMLSLAAPAHAQLQPVPALSGHLVDGAAMLDASQRAKLEAVLANYEAKTGSQIAVLTVKTTEPEAIEQFSIRVVEEWKLGRKGVDDGVLLLVAPNNTAALRRLRIEAGRGVQGVLTDAQSKRVLEDVIAPHFREKNYYEGLVAGVGAIATLLNQEQFPAPPKAQAPSSQGSGGGFPFSALIAVGIGFMVLRAMFGGRGRGASLGRGGWGSGATGFVIGSILSNAGRGGGGLGGGGFGGGGGFSGGGGSFDGGGASGDW